MTAVTAPDAVGAASPARRWYVLMVMCVVYTISIADRYVMSTVLEPIRLELKLTDGGVAFLTGVSLALFYVTLGIPLSWLADRTNRRNILAIALVAWSVMSVLCGLSRNYLQLLVARIGVGVGEAGGTPPANSIIADYFPPARRAMAMAVFALGAPIGAWLGADMAGAVAKAHGWRAAFLVLGAPGVLVGLLVFLTVKEPRRGRLDAPGGEAAPAFLDTLRFLLRQRACLHVMAGGGLSALWGWGLMWFTPTFLQRQYHLDVGEAGAVLGPIHLVAGVVSSLFTAWLLSRPAFGDPRRILLLLATVTGLATVPSFIVYWTHSLTVARVMLWMFIPAIYFYIGPAMALVQNLAPAKMRAMFIAISLVAANVLNLIVAPQAVGWLSDVFAGARGPDAASLRLALLILAPTGFWAAWHYWAARRTIVAEQAEAIGGGSTGAVAAAPLT
ncbi:MAG: MFS transporter [Caulobacteraceae bacterium]|nr:MFS transporter [Caulobacteraceae bacterium]